MFLKFFEALAIDVPHGANHLNALALQVGAALQNFSQLSLSRCCPLSFFSLVHTPDAVLTVFLCLGRRVPAGLITKSTACGPGATVAAISTSCRFIASVFRSAGSSCALTLFRAYGTEDVGGSGALVAGRTWARAARG